MVGIKGPTPSRTQSTQQAPKAEAPKTPAQPATTQTNAGWGPKPTASGNGVTPNTGFSPARASSPATAAAAPAAVAGPKAAGAPPMPKSIDEAFETMPATATATGEVRRHADNVMSWNMKWDIVTGAKKTVDFSYFSIERDAYGYAYLGALLDAQLRGVQVSGVTDWMANSRGHGFTGTGLGADYMQELVQHGAKIGMYDNPARRMGSLLEDGITYKVISSNHDKLSVSDAGTPEAMGETGGRNVARAYHQDVKDNPASWRDDSLQIKGEATTGLVQAMRREMMGPAVKMMKKDIFDVNDRATELLGAFQVMEKWTKGAPLSDAEKAAIRADPAKREAMAKQLGDEAIAAIKTMTHAPESMRNKKLTSGEEKAVRAWAAEVANDLELKGSRAKYDSLGGYMPAEVKILDQVGAASAAPGQRMNELGPGLFHLINGAQKEIVIQNPYVVLTEDMIKAFEEASKRGVNITIVTNSPESTDSAVTQGFFLNDWKLLQERVPTARIFVATGERKFHSKAFVADGKVSGDTSYNADLLSGLINGEVGAVSRSEDVAKNLLQHVYDDLADPANKFKEWTIQRNADGSAKKGPDGKPLTEFGPEHSVSPKLMRNYKVMQFLCDLITKHPLGKPLAHPN